MKLDFLERVPYVCERWAEVVAKDPAAVFLTEELSGNSYSREQVDDQSARVYAWLKQKEVGAEDFVLISLPRDARPFIARGNPERLRMPSDHRRNRMGRDLRDGSHAGL